MISRAVIIFFATQLAFQAAGASANQDKPFKTEGEVISYAVGVDLARNLAKQGIEIDSEQLTQGLKDGLAGRSLLSEKELRQVMATFQSSMRQRLTQNRRLAAEDNRAQGNAFLNGNKAKPDVITLASGLQYRVIKAGAADGRKPLDNDYVEVNYRGVTLAGTEFDVTEPGKPATLRLSNLIAGWKEALKLMSAGAKWQLFIPSRLAYGERGVGTDIGPNETLIFEVELVAIK